jgi:hypothetical protein
MRYIGTIESRFAQKLPQHSQNINKAHSYRSDRQVLDKKAEIFSAHRILHRLDSFEKKVYWE